MKSVTPAERRALRAKAHHLDPVVSIGQHGLTPAVLHEIDVALTAHELIKVRMFLDDRVARAGLGERIASQLDCANIQLLGKLLILWRPKPPGTADKSVAKQTPGPRMPSAAAHERRRRAIGHGPVAAPSFRSDPRAPRGKPATPRSPKAPAVPFAGDRRQPTQARSTPKRPGVGAPTRPDVRFAPRGPGRKPRASPTAARAPAANSRRRRSRAG